MLRHLIDLCEKYPAFFLGFFFLNGISLSLADPFISILPISALIILLGTSIILRQLKLSSHLLLYCLIAACGYAYAIPYRPVSFPPEGVHGTAFLNPKELKLKQSSIGDRWTLEASLDRFIADDQSEYSSLPVRLSILGKDQIFLPDITKTWKVNGRVLPLKNQGSYLFKPDSKTRWTPVSSSFSGWAASMRIHAKEWVKQYIFSQMEQSRSAPFLTAMITGDLDDTLLRHHFNRFGLQHILAISGFHFSLLALAISLIFSLFLPRSTSIIALCLAVTLYFIFLGPSPSIIRAWLTILLSSMAVIFKRQSTGINLLGISLLAVLAADPWSISNLGFQCSFAVTAGILLFTEPVDNLLAKLFPVRPLSVAYEWDYFTQHIYIISSWLRKTLALSTAINLTSIPILAFHYQSIPLMSLAYNLFFPFFISLSMLLLIIATFLQGISTTLGGIVHKLNGYFTYYVIGLAYDAPRAFDINFYFPEIPASIISSVLCVLFCAGLALQNNRRNVNTPFSY